MPTVTSKKPFLWDRQFSGWTSSEISPLGKIRARTTNETTQETHYEVFISITTGFWFNWCYYKWKFRLKSKDIGKTHTSHFHILCLVHRKGTFHWFFIILTFFIICALRKLQETKLNGMLDGIRYNVPSHDVKVHQQIYDKNTIVAFFFSPRTFGARSSLWLDS